MGVADSAPASHCEDDQRDAGGGRADEGEPERAGPIVGPQLLAEYEDDAGSGKHHDQAGKHHQPGQATL
jgi:hypothetical protein